MPAYRSADEAEIRDAAVARLRALRPENRIIHEINVAGATSNRVDFLSVGRAEIIAVEVKSKKDKIDRLPDQVTAMRGVAHHVIAAIHEKFLVEFGPVSDWSSHYERDGSKYALREPPESRGASVWVFPNRERYPGRDRFHLWTEPEFRIQRPLPHTALNMLWRAELLDVCSWSGVSAHRTAAMPLLINALRWSATGEQITKGICRALRARKALESDPPIEEAA